MKQFLCLLAFIFMSSLSFSATINTVKDGEWDDATVWEGGSVPQSTDELIIRHKIEIKGDDQSLRDGVLLHKALITVSIQETTPQKYDPAYAGHLIIHNGVTLKIEAGEPNQDAYLAYSANNDTPQVDHSRVIQGMGFLYDSIHPDFRENFLKGSSIIVKMYSGSREFISGQLIILDGGKLETKADVNIFGHAHLLAGGKLKVGDDLNILGDWSRLMVLKNTCGDFTVGDDVFIDCLGRIDHTHPGNIVFVGQSDIGTPETYDYLLNSDQTPPDVMSKLAFEKLFNYRPFLYHTPNPANAPIEALLDISTGGARYVSLKPDMVCFDSPADISIVKTQQSGELTPGGEWVYYITIKNSSTATANNIRVLEDTISNNFDLVSIEPVGGFTASWVKMENEEGVLENIVMIPSLEGRSEKVLKVTVKHHANSCEAMTNRAAIVRYTGFDQDTNPNNNESQITTPLADVNNLHLTGEIISVNEDDRSAQVKLTLENKGSFQSEVVVKNLIQTDSGSQIEPIENIGEGVTVNGQEITWKVTDLQAGEKVELVVQVKLQIQEGAQEISHHFEIMSPELLCNSVNQKGSIVIPFESSIVVEMVDLEISKEVMPDCLHTVLGGNITYVIKVRNLSDTVATNIVVEDIIDDALVSNWFWQNPSTGYIDQYKWIIPSLEGGESATIEVVATTIQNTCQESTINTVRISSLDQVDTNTSNNTDQVSTNLSGQADLIPGIEVVEMNSAMREVKVRIDLKNDSVQIFNDLKLAISLPEDVLIQNSQATHGSLNNKIWTISSLSSGTASLTIDLKVKPDSTIDNYTLETELVEFSPADADCDSDNNIRKINFRLPPPEVDLRIKKDVSSQTVKMGSEFNYFLQVTNRSTTTAATNVVVEDKVPAELTINEITAFDGSYALSGNDLLWTIPTILPGQTVVLQIKVVGKIADFAECKCMRTNTATIISSDLNNTNNRKSDDASTLLTNNEGINLEFVNSQVNDDDRSVRITLKVTANSSVDYLNVPVKLNFPSDFENSVSDIAMSGVFDHINNIWKIDSLPAGSHKTISFTLKLKDGVDLSGGVTYFVAAKVLDGLNGLNCIDLEPKVKVEFAPSSKPDIQVRKFVNKNSVKLGDELVYTIEVKNIGDEAATDVLIEDILSQELELLSQSDVAVDTGVVTFADNNRNIRWNIASINSDETYAMEIKVKVKAEECDDVIVNQASFIDENNIDDDSSNDSSSVSVEVKNEFDLIFNVTSGAPYTEDGLTKVKLTVEVTNPWNRSFQDLMIQNSINPSDFTFENQTDATLTFNQIGANQSETKEIIVVRNSASEAIQVSLNSEIVHRGQNQCVLGFNEVSIDLEVDDPWDCGVSPNPLTAGSALRIEVTSENTSSQITNGIFDISILNAMGQQVVKTYSGVKLTNGTFEINDIGLPAGAYFVKVTLSKKSGLKVNPKQITVTEKLVIIE